LARVTADPIRPKADGDRAGEPSKAASTSRGDQTAAARLLNLARIGLALPIHTLSHMTEQEFEMHILTQMDRLAVLALCAALAGCASVTPVAYSGVASSSYLAPNPSDLSGHTPYRYAAAVDWRTYDKVLVEPVVIYRGPDQQFGDMSEEDKIMLAHYMQSRFTEKLISRFTLASRPAPNMLRVRLTLTGAATTTPVLGTLSRFDIAGAAYNGVQAARDGEGLLTGSVIYTVEIFDAPTSRLLSAFVSKQYPNPYNIGASIGKLAAAQAGVDKGADALVAQMR
jgi:hypothetical protein